MTNFQVVAHLAASLRTVSVIAAKALAPSVACGRSRQSRRGDRLKLRLSVNSYNTQVATVADLRRELVPFASEQFREIWLEVEDGPALCVLLNGNLGWLMYLREAGDAGFSSRNPAFEGSQPSVIGYRLSNGQHDEYPASWALPEREIIRALEYFIEHQGYRAPFVNWHDDSA
jgi:immunity protein Imm1 of predicted polymorphic toxin system